MNENDEQSLMQLHAERITLADGRYLVFYTFTDPQQDQGSEPNDTTSSEDPQE
jgi:hypothetical protein